MKGQNMRRYRPLKNLRLSLSSIDENNFRFPVFIVPERLWRVFGRNIGTPTKRKIRYVNWNNKNNNNKR